jgi:hypothetical protein
LPSYYIDRPKLGDLFIYKVPLRVHPWGMNFILVNPKIYHYNFKNFCLCEEGGLGFEGLCAHWRLVDIGFVG